MTENAVASIDTILTLQPGQYSSQMRKIMADNARYLAMLKKLGISTDQLGTQTVDAAALMKRAIAAQTRATEMFARAQELAAKTTQASAVSSAELAASLDKATAASQANAAATVKTMRSYGELIAEHNAYNATLSKGLMSNKEFAASQARLAAEKEEDAAATDDVAAVMAEYNKVAAKGGEVTNVLAAAFDRATEAGSSTAEAMQAAVAAAEEYTVATEGATAATKGLVSGTSATYDAMRTLSGSEFGAARGAASLLSTTLGLGPVMQKMFPLIGAAAMGAMLFDMGRQLDKVFEKARRAGEALRQAFEKSHLDMQIVYDDAALVNSKLQDQIDKLEGHPGDGLKTALLEAVDAADKLQKKLVADNDALTNLLEKSSIGRFMGFLTGQAPTSPLDKEIQQKKTGVLERSQQANAAHTIALSAAGGNQKKIDAANTAYRHALMDAWVPYDKWISDQQSRYQGLQAQEQRIYEKRLAVSNPFTGTPQNPHRYRAAIQALSVASDNAKLEKATEMLVAKQEPLRQTANRLRGAAKPGRERAGRLMVEMPQGFGSELAAAVAKAQAAVDKAEWNKLFYSHGVFMAGPLGQQRADQTIRRAGGIPQTLQDQMDRLKNTPGMDLLSQYNGADMTRRLTDDTLSTVNNALAKLMTTGHGNFAGMFRGLGTNIAKEGIGGLENKFFKGPLEKLFGTDRPKGNASDPIHVVMARAAAGIGGLPGVGGAASGLMAKLNDSNWAGKLFGGKLFGSGGIFDSATGAIGITANGVNGQTGIGVGLQSLAHSLPQLALQMVLPGFASGGPISSGLPSIIGENGPELFVPRTSGHIVPNHRLGGGDTHINIDARGASDPAATAVAVRRAIIEMGHHAVKSSIHAQHEMKARTPGR